MFLKTAVIALTVVLFCASCKGTEEQLQCFEAKVQAEKQTVVYNDVRQSLQDTIQKWVSANLLGLQNYHTTRWVVDSTVFFNRTQDRAILLVLRQDTSADAKMDHIDMILAMKENHQWRFFLQSMPVITAGRYYNGKADPTVPYTYAELSLRARKRIVESGYFRKGTCEVNDSYVNDWYNPNMEDYHRDFLNNK